MRSNYCAIYDCETKICSEYLFIFEVMSSLRDQINEAEGKLQVLLAGKVVLTVEEGHLLLFLQEKLASLRAEVAATRAEVAADAQRARAEVAADAQSAKAEVAADAQLARDLRLAEAQRGEVLVCFTTIMLDKFNIDVEINLSHVWHLRLNSFKC